MHTAAYNVSVASDRRRRKNVPLHILCSIRTEPGSHRKTKECYACIKTTLSFYGYVAEKILHTAAKNAGCFMENHHFPICLLDI